MLLCQLNKAMITVINELITEIISSLGNHRNLIFNHRNQCKFIFLQGFTHEI